MWWAAGNVKTLPTGRRNRFAQEKPAIRQSYGAALRSLVRRKLLTWPLTQTKTMGAIALGREHSASKCERGLTACAAFPSTHHYVVFERSRETVRTQGLEADASQASGMMIHARPLCRKRNVTRSCGAVMLKCIAVKIALGRNLTVSNR